MALLPPILTDVMCRVVTACLHPPDVALSLTQANLSITGTL